jgi:hypothetical protein
MALCLFSMQYTVYRHRQNLFTNSLFNTISLPPPARALLTLSILLIEKSNAYSRYQCCGAEAAKSRIIFLAEAEAGAQQNVKIFNILHYIS